jgi:NADPH-dependent curcumin reductase CurA
MSMIVRKNKEVFLINRPIGLPKKTDFGIYDTEISPTHEGEVLIENHYFSVDPYMRGRMDERKSYVSPFQLNKPMSGGSVGKIIESKNSKFEKGEFVYGSGAWRQFFKSDGDGLLKIDPNLAPISYYLSAFGMTGLTAYIGLTEIGNLKEKDTVFISAAAGAVGSIACQIAKIHGCRVVGSAGSDEKVKYLLNEVGIDEAINYKTVPNLKHEISMLCPRGVDLYFDNVGGDMLEAMLFNMKTSGRVVICGMISQYNKEKPDPIHNLILTIQKRLRIQGFIVSDHYDKLPEFIGKMARWYSEGKIKQKETIIEGIENSVDAFLGLFSGENIGKMIVKL